MPLDTISYDASDREALMATAAETVTRAAGAGRTLSVHAEAERLLAAYPRCQLTFDDVQDEIARIAVRNGVAVEFG